MAIIPSGQVGAADGIAALICGLPKAARERAFLVMLVAYFDDSGSQKQGPVMVVAGWVARVTPWIEFSDQWQALLDEKPGLGYFKLREASRCEEQFGRFRPKQRDDRVLKFLSLVRKYVAFGVVSSFNWSELKTAQKETTAMIFDPYQVLFHGIMATVVYEVLKIDPNARILFVFDIQGAAGRRAEMILERVLPILPPRLRNAVMGVSELDDKEILPLQAADALAWMMRRHAEKNPTCKPDLGDFFDYNVEPYLEPLRGHPPRVHTHYPIARFRKMIADHNEGKVLS